MTDKEQLFIEKLIQFRNGTKAYMYVYPDSSYDAAAAHATRMKKKLVKEIDQRRREMLEAEGDITLQNALRLLGLINSDETKHSDVINAIKQLEIMVGNGKSEESESFNITISPSKKEE